MSNQEDHTFTTRIEKRKLYLKNTAIIIISILLILFLYWLFISRFYIDTDDAYVNGNIVQVSSQTTGTIKQIYVDITDYVKMGDVLLTIEQDDANVKLARARANLARTIREVQQHIQAIEEARAILALRKAQFDNALDIFNRRESLWKTRNVSEEDWHTAKATKDEAEAQFKQAEHDLAQATAFVQNSTPFNHPLVEAAKADFKSAYLDKERTTIYAPVTGYIAKRNSQVGSLANVGTILFAIVPLNEIWVDANFKETQLKRLRIGQPVELIADKNGRKYHGKIAGFYPGTGAIFSLLPAQNASGNWIKITQRLPVRINLDSKEIEKFPLEIGLSMVVTVNTHDLNLPMLNKQQTNTAPRYSTTIYQKQLEEADKEMTKIFNEQSETIKKE